MKNIFVLLLALGSTAAFAQVIVGNTTGTATNKNGVLLEFAAGQNKGLILPYVRTLPTAAAATPGTIAVDASNNAAAKVVYRNNTAWVDLSSGNTANLTGALGIQPGVATTESAAAKTVIGANASSADGVLVLESTTKAMVLPIVASTMDVISPAPGMMVYVNAAGAKRLAVYNGAVWTYWKP